MKPPRGGRGRGSASNPKSRFESIERIPEPPDGNDDVPSPHTQFFPDRTKSIIAYNDSPDVGFDASVNAYRGSEHGCIYSYARPSPRGSPRCWRVAASPIAINRQKKSGSSRGAAWKSCWSFAIRW